MTARLITTLLVFFVFSFAWAKKKPFTPDLIPHYLHAKNPFVFQHLGKALEARAKETFYLGAFDTMLSMQHDNKQYPATQGTFSQAALTQPFGNGIELSLSYRNAQGVQEFNNIKTSNQGEMLAGVKIPVFSAWFNISKRQIDLLKAKLTTQSNLYLVQGALLTLYKTIAQAYYQMLYYQALLQTERELLQKAVRNDRFIKKEIDAGKRPKIARVESQNLIMTRKQRLLQAKNNFLVAKQMFVQYLGLSPEMFDKRYRLPKLPMTKARIPQMKKALALAYKQRPEPKAIRQSLKSNRLDLQLNRLEAYPKLNLKAYGAYDLKYDEGYKVSLDFNLPLQRRRYKGEKEALKVRRLTLLSQLDTFRIKLQTALSNTLTKMRIRNQTIALAQNEVKLAQRVEEAELLKYKEGISQLLQVNQRQMATLQAKQRLITHYFQLRLLETELDYIMGNATFLKQVKLFE